ncbi:sugar transporter [Leptodontidium sp. 2 PMI_412]|nr:sugar transporter [Leptodontidium sp. 2 PMI_412]
MLENAGITSQSRKLFLNGIDTPLCFVASVTGTMFLDKAGRRPLLIWRIHTHLDNSYAANSSIAFIYIFGIIFSFAWTPLSPMYVVECLHTNTRAKGKALAQLFTACASVVIQYASGPAFQHIKYYFYIAFNGWDVIELVIIYFFWPETKDRTLEELDEWFQAPHPVTKILEPRGMSIVFNTLNIETKHSKFEDY